MTATTYVNNYPIEGSLHRRRIDFGTSIPNAVFQREDLINCRTRFGVNQGQTISIWIMHYSQHQASYYPYSEQRVVRCKGAYVCSLLFRTYIDASGDVIGSYGFLD